MRAEPSDSNTRLQERTILFAALLVAAALAVRGFASLTELWLDEIWSLRLAAHVQSPLDVLSLLRHDNNHPLNTLLLAWIGPTDAWVAYRVPALLSSVAGIALAAVFVRRRGEAALLAALLLHGASAFLIQYASEARGYAPALTLGLGALVLADPELRGEMRARLAFRVVGYGACALGAMLFHVTALAAVAAAGAWRVLQRWKEGAGFGAIARDVLVWQSAPALGLAALWFGWLRHLQIGGGPDVDPLEVALSAASLSVGLPLDGVGAAIGATLAALLCLGGIAWLAVEGSSRWLVYALGVVVLPASALLVARPEFLAPRYFLVSAGLFLLLLAEMIGAAWRSGPVPRVACAVALGVFVLANALQMQPLLEHGRGQYLAALRHMTDRAQTPVHVASDHDLRTGMVVDFYARYFEPDRRVRYRSRADWSRQGADWFVLERAVEERDQPRAPLWIVDPVGNRYRLEKGYPGSTLSGVDWFLYRNTRTVAP